MMIYRGYKKPLNCNYSMCHEYVTNFECAFQNAQSMYEWYKINWGTDNRYKSILLYLQSGESILKMVPKDITKLSAEFVQLYALDNVDKAGDSLAEEMEENSEIRGYRGCTEHYSSLSLSKRNCINCAELENS